MSEFIQLPVEGVVGKINNRVLIEGVKVKAQRLIPDARGFLMELMRPDWPEFIQWGQVYATMCYPGVVKGWHYHYHQIDSFNCVCGMGKVVLFDNRPNSPTNGIINEFIIGPLNPKMVQIPNFVWHGFAAVGPEPAIIINCPTRMYNYTEPDEYRAPHDSFGYKWNAVNG